MNLTPTASTLLADEVKQRDWEKWNEGNQEAIAAYNQHIAKHGLPLAKYRTWGKSLGDGRKEGATMMRFDVYMDTPAMGTVALSALKPAVANLSAHQLRIQNALYILFGDY